ncbi:MAG: cyclodeaminase/cyclohydrolase family protein [Desulfoferrobacter sp.]
MKESFLEQLSKPQPDPGGGAVAAYGAALGLALLEKVVRLELGRRRSATELHRPWHSMIAEIQDLTGDFSRLLKGDIEAYKQLVVARSRGNEDLLSDAIARAIDCPMEIMLKVRQVLILTCKVVELCKQHLVADLWVAVEFLEAALRGAHHIASANVPMITNATERETFQFRLSKELDSGMQIAEKASGELLKRLSNRY